MVTQTQVLFEWHRAVRLAQTCHLRSAARSDRLRKGVGATASVLAALVGTSIFVTLEDRPEAWIRIVVGLFSITAAALSAIQVFMKRADNLERYEIAATQYDAFRRELEARLPLPDMSDKAWESFAADFRKRLQAVTAKAPTYSQKILGAAEAHVDRREPFPGYPTAKGRP